MSTKPGFFARTRDAVIALVLALVVVATISVALAFAGNTKLIDLPYRAYDRFPDDPKLRHFLSEEESEDIALKMIRAKFDVVLMPSDDWLILDCPMGDRIQGIRQPFHAGNATLGCSGTMAFPGARVAEISQESTAMRDHRGLFRCFAAYLESASFPDTLSVLTTKGERTVVVWRSGKEPRSEGVVSQGAVR